MSWASTVSCGAGVTWNFLIRMARPRSMTPSRMPSHISVFCARRARGLRNCGTALAMASTPVSAEHPDAKARSSNSRLTAVTVCGRCWTGATAGVERTSPATMTAPMAMMNRSVGMMNARAASATPHMLTPVMMPSTARHSHTLPPYSAGNADVRAATPADTPTAALST